MIKKVSNQHIKMTNHHDHLNVNKVVLVCLMYVNSLVVGDLQAILGLKHNGSSITANMVLEKGFLKFDYFWFHLVNITDPLQDQCHKGQEIDSQVVHQDKPGTNTTWKFEVENTVGRFCLMVRPISSIASPTDRKFIFSEVYNFTQDNNSSQRKPSLGMSVDCSTFDYTYKFFQLPKSADVKFRLNGSTICFKYKICIQLSIFRDQPNRTTSKCENTNKSTASDVYYSSGGVTFSNLSEGVYCISVIPEPSESCYGHCEQIYTEPLKVTNNILPTGSPTKTVSKLENDGWKLAVSMSVAGLAAFILIIFILIRRKFDISKNGFQSVPSGSHREPILRDDQNHQGQEIWVLYSPGGPEAAELEGPALVSSLVNFLREETEQVIHLDLDEIPSLSINSEAWYKQMCDQARVVMVIESESAVLRQQGSYNSKIVRRCDDDPLDDLFIKGLLMLTTRVENMANYSGLAVVHFPHTPQEVRLEFLAEQQRYFLMGRLYELVYFLRFFNEYKEQLDIDRRKSATLERWETQPSYLQLQKSMYKAQEYVQNRPNYLQEEFQIRECMT